MKLLLQLSHPAWRTRRAGLRTLATRACGAALAQESIANAELSVLLTDDAAIRALNHDFRGKDKATNVLAFPFSSPCKGEAGRGTSTTNADDIEQASPHPTPPPVGEGIYLGDIAVSLDTTAREAAEQNKTFEDHLTHLLVHACLHLLGHDHMKKAEAARMEKKEIAILQQLGIKNPYL